MGSACKQWRFKHDHERQCNVALNMVNIVRDGIKDAEAAAGLAHIFTASGATCRSKDIAAFTNITSALLLQSAAVQSTTQWLASHPITIPSGAVGQAVYLPGCNNAIRLGTGDGSKVICNPTTTIGSQPCNVISVGSNGDASFERAVHAMAPHCRISTWDGTLVGRRSNLASALPSWLTFIPANFHAASWKRYTSDGVRTINLLKIDCEGCEVTALPSFLDRVCAEQIVVELHSSPTNAYKNLLARLSRDYIPFYGEHNPSCVLCRCVEISWKRRVPCAQGELAKRETASGVALHDNAAPLGPGAGVASQATLFSSSGACCRRGRDVSTTRLGWEHNVSLPSRCIRKCAELGCRYFSHSTFYQECLFCRSCRLESLQSSMAYSSWKVGGRPSEAASSSATSREAPRIRNAGKYRQLCNNLMGQGVDVTRSPRPAAKELATLPYRQPIADSCILLPRIETCPTSLGNALNLVVNAVLVASVLGIELTAPEVSRNVLGNCSDRGFPRFQLAPTLGETRQWPVLAFADLRARDRGASSSDPLRLAGRCIWTGKQVHGQDIWGPLMSAAKLAGYDDDQSLVSLGPHAAFGHVLRRAFAFADAISVGLRDDDELRISVHVRHFVLESEIVAPQADAASLHTIEGRIAAILSTSSMPRCAILLASDRRLTLSLFEEIAARVGCRLVTSQRQAMQFTSVSQMEHGVDSGGVALRDLELLSHGHLLFGSWGSSFTLAIQELIASRYLPQGRRARLPLPTVTYCCEAKCLEPLPLVSNGTTSAAWYVSLASFPYDVKIVGSKPRHRRVVP